MHRYFFLLTLFFAVSLQSQIHQNIFLSSDTSVQNLMDIDSIRFDVNAELYEIVYTNGVVSGFSIASIDSVNFHSLETPAESCAPSEVLNGLLVYGMMSDSDGNVYNSIIVNGREWMAENLRSSHYSNGDLIPYLEEDTLWMNATEGASCWYLGDSALYGCPQGKLYNWFAAADPRNICPLGWHVPTDMELSELLDFLDPSAGGGLNPNNSGGKMKSSSTSFWTEPNMGATNESGLSVIGTGYRSSFDGSYTGAGDHTYLWSKTEDASYSAWERFIANNTASAFRGSAGKKEGFSVRCLRD